MTKKDIYEAGSQYWVKIGRMTRGERIALIKNIEDDIRNNITVSDEVLFWLIAQFEEERDDAREYQIHKEAKGYIEMLHWLRSKNTAATMLKEQLRIMKALEGCGVSQSIVTDVMDLLSENVS